MRGMHPPQFSTCFFCPLSPTHTHIEKPGFSLSWPQIVLLFPQLLWDPFSVSLIRAPQLSFSFSPPFSFFLSNQPTHTHRRVHTHRQPYSLSLPSSPLCILSPIHHKTAVRRWGCVWKYGSGVSAHARAHRGHTSLCLLSRNELRLYKKKSN